MVSLKVTSLRIMVAHVPFTKTEFSFKIGFYYSDFLRQISCLATMI